MTDHPQLTTSTTEADATLEDLPIDRLSAHPDNPRLALREEVVDRIAAELRAAGFGPQHAILVRPHGEGWQVISGHHRWEAARRAGLATVPAWVKDMDDDEAFMQLVLSNSQGELTPLEIGMHALRAVPLAQGSRSGGGLAAYAERLGRSDDSVRQWRAAAAVVAELPDTCREVHDRHRHLYEIGKAPRETWAQLVAALVKRGWTVEDTKAAVDKVRAFTISDLDAAWLPLPLVVERFLSSGKPSPAAIEQLAASAYTVFKAIDTRGDDDQYEDNDAFQAWLVEHAGRRSWDRKEISGYHVDLIRKWAERDAASAREAAEEDAGPLTPDGIDLRVGQFQTALSDIAAGTVDAIITDPPYPEEFLPLFGDLAEHAARLLKPGGVCAVMIGQSYLPQIVEAMSGHLRYHWTLAYLTPGGQAVQLWQRKVNTFWKPILVFTNGEYQGDWIGDVTASKVNDNDKEHHFWGQSESGTADLVDRLTKPGWLVCDPFLGGGTTAVVCHALGRRFVGCDVEESCVEVSRGRFAIEETAA